MSTASFTLFPRPHGKRHELRGTMRCAYCGNANIVEAERIAGMNGIVEHISGTAMRVDQRAPSETRRSREAVKRELGRVQPDLALSHRGPWDDLPP